MSARNGWPIMSQLRGDPSTDPRATPDQLLDFNRRLYAPGAGTRTAPAAPTYPTGWQSGTQDTADSILKQYQTPGTVAGYSNLPPRPVGTPVAAGFPIAGAAGPTGATGIDPGQDSYAVAPGPTNSIAPMGGPYEDSRSPGRIYDANGQFNPAATFAAATPPAGVNPPQGNAMQMHQQEAATPPDMRPISAARRFYWATGRIDGRAPTVGTNYQGANALTNFDATFGPGAAHMGSPGTTWDQRQQSNQQHIADASTQRGLDFSPY